jgi:flagellar M-ring protein FliF
MRNSPQIESISIGIAVDRESFAPGEEANIVRLAAAAANVADTSVSVVNFKFYSDQVPEEPESTETGIPRLYVMLGAIAAGLVLLALIILVLLSRRNKRRRAAEEAAAAEAAAAALAATEADELIEYDEEGFPIVPSKGGEIGPITPMRDKRREEIQEFAKSNPEITAQMIKTLLKAEEG